MHQHHVWRPGPVVQKSCFSVVGPLGYTYCTAEGQTCALSGLTDVAYGANGSFYYKYGASRNVACNNATFGDPAVYVQKACFTVTFPRTMTYCAPEGGLCALSVPTELVYGTFYNGHYYYRYIVAGNGVATTRPLAATLIQV
jgi:hypothetical protein